MKSQRVGHNNYITIKHDFKIRSYSKFFIEIYLTNKNHMFFMKHGYFDEKGNRENKTLLK